MPIIDENLSGTFAQLEALRAQQNELQHSFEAQQEELKRRRQQVQQELYALQTQLDAIIHEQQQLPLAQHAQEQHIVDQEADLLADTLGTVQAAISQSVRQAQAAYALDQQITLLLNTQQGLAEKWKNYQEFEEKREQLLAILPAFHHTELLESHAKLARELTPLFNLAEARKKFDAPQHVDLICLCLYSEESIELALVLPIPARPDTTAHTDETSGWRQLENFVNQAFFAISKASDWDVSGTEPKQWAGFLVLHTIAIYSGAGDLLLELSSLLQGYSDLHREESPLQITWRLVPLSAATWQARYAESRAQEELVSEITSEIAGKYDDVTDETSVGHSGEAQAEPLSAGVAEAEDASEEIGNQSTESQPTENQELAGQKIEGVMDPGGWYTNADITSWQRPLKTKDESKWSRNGRQLRTLLTRLVAKGIIESHYVPATHLWAGLPMPLAKAMQDHLNRLIDREMILAQDLADGERQVTLNPALLDEAQNLINRTVTPFWEELVVD